MINIDTNYFYLFVDDDSFTNYLNKKMIDRVLDKPHYTIFQSSIEALLFLKDFVTTPQRQIVLFLDLQLPQISGVDFLRLVHNDVLLSGLHLTIITLSNHEKSHYEKHFNNFSKVKGFINKPLSSEDINQVIRKFSE